MTDSHDNPWCAECGHVESDHRPGRCGASVDDDDGEATYCDCGGMAYVCHCQACERLRAEVEQP